MTKLRASDLRKTPNRSKLIEDLKEQKQELSQVRSQGPIATRSWAGRPPPLRAARGRPAPARARAPSLRARRS